MTYGSIRKGNRYGKLEVISDISVLENGYYKWLCRCDCGKKKLVMSCNLVSGNTRSCGCETLAEKKQAKDHTGEKYNCIEVICRDYETQKALADTHPYWTCRCTLCGCTFPVVAAALRKRRTCGTGACRKKYNALKKEAK